MTPLALEVRRLDDPGLWTWVICDEIGSLVESSWQSAWTAFESRAEAQAAGEARLERLSRLEAA